MISLLKKLVLENRSQFFLSLLLILLKFLFVRGLLFENANPFYTIFVEIGYILLILGLVEFLPYKKIKKTLYIVINFIFSVLLLAVLIYNDYFGYIVTIHVFSQIGQVGTVKDSVLQLIDPIYLLLFVDFVLLTIYYSIKKNASARDLTRYNGKFMISVLILGIVLIGYNIYVQKDSEIANTVLAAEKKGILTYEILAAKDKAAAEKAPTLTEKEVATLPDKINEVKGIVSLSNDQLKLAGVAKDKNVIIIQAEAFQDFTINLKVNGQEVTPFLNQFINESMYFSNIFQQIGPGNTSDAEFMSNTSLYPSAWTATSETFGDRDIPSFPKLLKAEGYKTMTFHPNDVTFWNRDQLYPALGFDQYYDIKFFGNEDIVGMGPSDEYVYKKALTELKKLHEEEQNFYAQIVTLSSHHPFKIPDEKDNLNLPEEFNGSIVGDYLKAIHYTDQALKQFVEDLKKNGMWEDTVLIMYGDHFGLQPNGLANEDFGLLKELVGHDYSFLDQFNIPLFISVGDQNIAEGNETIGSQLDIMPTVSNLLGLPLNDYVHFGQDIINYPNNLFGMRYYMPVGSFFNNEIAFKPAEGFVDGEGFNIHTAEAVTFSQYENDYDRILQLLKMSDEYMNSLPRR